MELQEFDISFNLLTNEQSLWFLTQAKSVNVVIITGNPLAKSKVPMYANFEAELQKNLSGVVINEVGKVDDDGYYVKRKPGQP